jgi:hypothetical protein
MQPLKKAQSNLRFFYDCSSASSAVATHGVLGAPLNPES